MVTTRPLASVQSSATDSALQPSAPEVQPAKSGSQRKTKSDEPMTQKKRAPRTTRAPRTPPTKTKASKAPLSSVSLSPPISALNGADDPLLDRELSLLAFNQRVLRLAADPAVPLLERLRYLTIVSTNLDEFFEVRIADLAEPLRGEGKDAKGAQHAALRHQLTHIAQVAHQLVADQYHLFNDELLPALRAEGLLLLHHDERNEAQREWVREYFLSEVKPLLTPIGLDPSHPFPQVVNKSLNFIVELAGKDAFGRASGSAIVKAPRVLPRVIPLPDEICAKGTKAFTLLSSVLRAHLVDLFPGREVVSFSQFRVTRDSELFVDDGEVKNLRQALSRELTHRAFGHVVRLEVTATCAPHLSRQLLEHFGLAEQDLYHVPGPVNLGRLNQLLELIERPDLRFAPHHPQLPKVFQSDESIFDVLSKRDVLLHQPFESFEPVIEFLRQAAADPKVVAIKQTVYRTGAHSAVMEALIEAARRGKEITVIVELKARFDEEANINWADRLHAVGVQVVYGVVGLKTHSKMLLVTRREGRKLRHYAHLGTGNYHPGTARAYTDFGMLTAQVEICDDVAETFLHLTSLSKAKKSHHIWLAPLSFAKQLLKAIERETEHALAGNKGRIIAKMNSLTDEATIHALYAASQAGVGIELVIRGACALRPGVPGLSENIRVISVVGRFLEHTRIYFFHNDGAHDTYLSSSDWMARNLFRRVEIAWPVLDKSLKKRVMDEGLLPYLQDTKDAYELSASGTYHRLAESVPASAQASSAQTSLLEHFK